MRESIKRVEPVDQHLNQVWLQPVPEHADLETVCSALELLVSRHESMRTRYAFDDSGRPRQRVVGQGAFPVELRDCADLEHWSDAAVRELRNHHYDLVRGPLLKVLIAVSDGRPRLLAMGLSHMVADGWGLRVIRTELAQSMDQSRDAQERPDRAWQPSDQIRHERTPAAIRQGNRSLDYIAAQLKRFPSTMFWRRREHAEHPRYRSGTLRAPALLPAVSQIYAAHKVTPAAAVFAAFSSLIGDLTRRDANCMFLVYSNRTQQNLNSVANYSQTVPIVVDLCEESFWGLMKSTNRAMLNAYRHAAYPPDGRTAIKDAIGRSRGIGIVEDCVFNPRWRAIGPELEQQARSGLRASDMPSGAFSWNPGADRGLLLYFGLTPNAISLTADTRFVAPEEFEPALRRIESLVVKGADTDFDPTPIIRNRRVPPDDDWAYIDHCWIDLRSTQEMVAQAIGAESVEVEAALDEQGQTILVARLPPDRSTPDFDEVRVRCLRALGHWRNAMVPHVFENLDVI